MISVHITDTAIEGFQTPAPGFVDCGALVEFAGVIRPDEQGERIRGIRYEAYQPMAESVMREKLESLQHAHGFLAAEVVHRIGAIDVGSMAIRVRIGSVHRREALAATMEFMDELKRDVPIWKVETY